MKSFVITIKSEPKSVAIAQRCIDSMPQFDVQMFDAITPKDDPFKIAKEKGISLEVFEQDKSYSRIENCISAFLSHHTLWEMCYHDKEEYQIFEHDAVCVNNIPQFIPYEGCISLGAPSYGKFNTPKNIGVNPLTSKPYFPGAHAYRLKPIGAKTLINRAKIDARTTDIFLSIDKFPWLQEYYPWPVAVKESFTTIQKIEGCVAKHGYKGGYEILKV